MKAKILIVFFSALLVFAIFFSVVKSKDSFTQEISQCNSSKTEFRFSCYRKVIEKYYGTNLKGFSKFIGSNKDYSFEKAFEDKGQISYAIFGTNCHTFYHAAGDFVATHTKGDKVKLLLSRGGTSSCTNGFTMGLYKRLALENHFSTDLLNKFWRFCRPGAENQCAHEIGHLLHDKYTYPILKKLDDISKKQYKLTYPTKYDYITSAKIDLNAPFAECEKIVPATKLAQCFTGIGHNFFVFSEFAADGYRAAFDDCAKTNEKNKNPCFAFLIYRIGINDVATKFLSGQFEKGREICAKTTALAGSNDFKEHCYRGIGGGIGLYIDSVYSYKLITDQNLVAVKRELLDYLKLCDKSEENYVDICYSGLFGTRYTKLYDKLKIYHERVEKLRPNWKTDFEVVG